MSISNIALMFVWGYALGRVFCETWLRRVERGKLDGTWTLLSYLFAVGFTMWVVAHAFTVERSSFDSAPVNSSRSR